MTHTSTEIHSELTQEEKRRIMKDDRLPTTFSEFAKTLANETKGGRYGKSDASPLIRPLPSGPWSAQPGPGDEPPLGVDINAVPDLGFPLNQQSVAQAPAKSPAVETATDDGVEEQEPRSTPSLSTTEE
jgi:hypothetical protein